MLKKDYMEYCQYMLDIDEDEIKELENGNFSTAKKLNFWMTYHRFEYVFAIIKGCYKNYDDKMLDFISILATSLSCNTRLRFETANLINFIKYYSNKFLSFSNIDILNNKLDVLTPEELIELLQLMISKICEIIQIKVDEVKKTMQGYHNNSENLLTRQNKMQINGFNIENINNLFENYQFNNILKRLTKYSEYIDFDMLNFISLKAQYLMFAQPENILTNDELIFKIEHSGIIPSAWLSKMSREELIYEFNQIIIKRCTDILKKVISICFNNLEKYGLILEKLYENAKWNDKIRLNLSNYLPDHNSNDFSLSWNKLSNDEKERINYIADALEYGAITNSIHNICKTDDTIESLLFKEGISTWNISKSILEANDKRILATIILKYIDEGILQFNGAIKPQLPTFFKSVEK